MEYSDLGKEQFKMVVELRHRAHRGAGRFYRPALIDGNARRNTLNALHVRLVHPVQKLARVSRKTYASDDGKSVERNLQIEVLEVVLLGAANLDPVLAHGRFLIEDETSPPECAENVGRRSSQRYLLCPEKVAMRSAWHDSRRPEPLRE